MVPDSIANIDRPDKGLFRLYAVRLAIATVGGLFIAFPFVLLGMLPFFVRYFTMRYRFTDEGVGVQWGYLFRRESYLTYEKIQDIHLNRGLLERWLGLGTVSIQTASGSSGAEISLIGLTAFDEVRDYLYGRMRKGTSASLSSADGDDDDDDDALSLLREIRDEVVRLQPVVPPGQENVDA